MFVLYNLALILLAPVWVPWMLWRSRKRKEAVIWSERLGNLIIPELDGRFRVWFHAVSVGEVIAAKPILLGLKNRGADVVLTVTTSSGHQTAREQLVGCFDHLCYFPIDLAWVQRRALYSMKPNVVVIMETELWLNLLHAARALGVKTILVNGRISERSFATSLRIRGYYTALFSRLDHCLAQTVGDAHRLRLLGAARPKVFGNVKYDQALSDKAQDPRNLAASLNLDPNKLTLVVGSTRSEMEEQLVVDAIKRVGLEELQVVHAPRHLERTPMLAQSITNAFGTCALRSTNESGPYVVLDTFGELGLAYQLADLVVIGGSFDNLGGQNLIQPLALGKPVIHGPSMFNFREAASQAAEVGATMIARDSSELAEMIRILMKDKDRRTEMGRRGVEMVESHRGAAERYVEAILDAK